MISPLNWVLANAFFDRIGQYPPTGSYQELLVLIVFGFRQDAEYHKHLSLVQGIINPSGKEVHEAFNAYRKAAFPYMEDLVKKEKDDIKDMLSKFVGLGPIGITPPPPQVPKSVLAALRRGRERFGGEE